MSVTSLALLLKRFYSGAVSLRQASIASEAILYIGIEAVAEDFTELSYLAANPDVEEAVRLAIFSSGFEHWQNYGKTEGRLLAPAAGPTEFMISVGVSRS